MKKLLIYPTSRAIRKARSEYLENDTLLPHMMRMDEFEQRCVLLDGAAMVDPLQRVLLLREAADFEAFTEFKMDKALVKFLSGSESFFRFFEELAGEMVDIGSLSEADVYAEFPKHIDILYHLKQRYKSILDSRGLSDRMFIPGGYQLNIDFISRYDSIEIYIEGLLSRYEMNLLERISATAHTLVHFTTSPFGGRMLDRLGGLGILLPSGSDIILDMSTRKLLDKVPADKMSNVSVRAVQERFEQIPAAFEAIEEMVSDGLDPMRIALVLPDENFKEAFRLYDKFNNLNFAMGFDYSGGRNYKIINSISSYLAHYDDESLERIERYGLSVQVLRDAGWVSGSVPVSAKKFIDMVDQLQLTESDPMRMARVGEAKDEFVRIFSAEQMSVADWLYLWLQKLGDIRIDDLRGGMITVMGVLETRGVAFDGVVIVDFNEGVVPASSAKDQFLNTQVRAFAGLPTKADREALQKHYYHRLLSQARRSSIIYTSGGNKLPSKFLYELGMDNAEISPVQLDILYDQPVRIVEDVDRTIGDFDACSFIWSASRFNTWLSCKRKFYYRYIREIKAKPEEDINEGAVLHRILDHMYKLKERYDSPDELKTALWRAMDDELPGNNSRVEYYKILWKEKLEPFIEQQTRHFAKRWRIVERESEYLGEIYGLKFRGRIDRIDRRDNEAMVIDYKSGSLAEANRSKNLENATDFQMNIYRHLLSKKYPNATFVFQKILEGGELIEAAAMDEKEEYLKSHLEQLSNTKEFTAEKTEKLNRCKYCEFALMCGRGEYL